MPIESRLEQILAEWLEAHEQGRAADPEAFIAAYPEAAEELREHFAALRALSEAFVHASRVESIRPPDAATVPTDPPTTDLRELQPNRYVDFRPVGEGGMGLVYWALDTDLNRQVAFKVVRPHGDSGDTPSGTPEEPWALLPPEPDSEDSPRFEHLTARFLQEAWVTGGLEHPGIVPVYELGQTPEGVPYYTMRFIRGERTLKTAIGDGAEGSFEDRLKLLEPFLKVCDTIEYAHAQGVVHRDLKPDNIALGEYGEVVVLDWGLAKLSDADDTPDEIWHRHAQGFREQEGLATQAGLGTPGYMSPEAALVRLEEVDEQSDVYSLGAILFEILTGRPFVALGNMREFIERVSKGASASPHAVDPEVPNELSEICMQATARDRALRTRCVADLSHAVRDWQASSVLEHEVKEGLQRARTHLQAAESAEGDARIAQADEARTRLARILEKKPDSQDGEDLLSRATELREQGIRERERKSRRRILVRGGIAALVVATLAGFLFTVQLERRRKQAEDARVLAERANREKQTALLGSRRLSNLLADEKGALADQLTESERLRGLAETAEREAVAAREEEKVQRDHAERAKAELAGALDQVQFALAQSESARRLSEATVAAYTDPRVALELLERCVSNAPLELLIRGVLRTVEISLDEDWDWPVVPMEPETDPLPDPKADLRLRRGLRDVIRAGRRGDGHTCTLRLIELSAGLRARGLFALAQQGLRLADRLVARESDTQPDPYVRGVVELTGSRVEIARAVSLFDLGRLSESALLLEEQLSNAAFRVGSPRHHLRARALAAEVAARLGEAPAPLTGAALAGYDPPVGTRALIALHVLRFAFPEAMALPGVPTTSGSGPGQGEGLPPWGVTLLRAAIRGGSTESEPRNAHVGNEESLRSVAGVGELVAVLAKELDRHLAGEPLDPALDTYVQLALARFLAWAGRSDLATSLRRRALARAEERRLPLSEIRAVAALLRTTHAAGDPAETIALTRHATRVSSGLFRDLFLTDAHRARAQFGWIADLGIDAALSKDDMVALFEFLEQGRAVALSTWLQRRSATRDTEVPAGLRVPLARGRARVQDASRRYWEARDGGNRREVRNVHREQEQARLDLAETLSAVEEARLALVRGESPGASTLEDTQVALETDEALILLARLRGAEDTGHPGRWMALVVQRSQVRVLRWQAPHASVDPASVAAGMSEESQRDDAFGARFRQALGPLPGIRRLFVSFGDSVPLVAPAMLLPEHEVYLTPSAQALVLLRARPQVGRGAVLAIGDPIYGSGGTDSERRVGPRLPPLPATRKEAVEIGDVVLLGEDATVGSFLTQLTSQPRWRAIHLATHVREDRENPLFSGFNLTPGPDHDGVLLLFDVLQLDLTADLVGLSFCESTTNESAGGIGLLHGFLLAGASSVLGSLWNADDEATSTLMIKFYELWSNEELALTSGEALRRAQAFVRAHEQWKPHRYWAGWAITGVPR